MKKHVYKFTYTYDTHISMTLYSLFLRCFLSTTPFKTHGLERHNMFFPLTFIYVTVFTFMYNIRTAWNCGIAKATKAK